MSLYCFGKLRLSPKTQDSFVFPAKVTIRSSIDPCDAEELDKINALAGDEIYFQICDAPDSCDATGLWLEIENNVEDEVMKSRLGRTIHSLLFDPQISSGAIALVDGGIEIVLEGAPTDVGHGFWSGRVGLGTQSAIRC